MVPVLIERVIRSVSRGRNRGTTCEPTPGAAQEVRDHRKVPIWLDGSASAGARGRRALKIKDTISIAVFYRATGFPLFCVHRDSVQTGRFGIKFGRVEGKGICLSVHETNCAISVIFVPATVGIPGLRAGRALPNVAQVQDLCLRFILTFPGAMQSTGPGPSEWHKLVVVLVKPPNLTSLLAVFSVPQVWPAKVAWVSKVSAFLPKTFSHSFLSRSPGDRLPLETLLAVLLAVSKRAVQTLR